jgi:DNA (cytosine-5)-methyltransferase 1
MNYYNDNDPKACAWLRELIADGHLPPGYVDERSIIEIKADELRGYDQCHFFAGVGFWSLALQWAGLGTTPGIWTGSCPCQPFSCAGAGKGTADERHLWPVFRDLIIACRPAVVFGEQVASAAVIGKVGRGVEKPLVPVWLDGVRADVEAAGYAFGAAVMGAHSVGAPHIRQRLYWVADRGASESEGARGRIDMGGLSGAAFEGVREPQGQDERRTERDAGRTFDIGATRWQPWCDSRVHRYLDGKDRRIPAEPRLFPLADDRHPYHRGRVGLLRGAGNAIVPALAAEFIEAWKDCQTDEKSRLTCDRSFDTTRNKEYQTDENAADRT